MSRKRKMECLVIGEASEPELREAADWLAADKRLEVHRASTPDQAQQAAFPVIDWIVFLQDHPGQFSSFQIERLHRRWPLAHLICGFGAWCEGEGRSGRPPVGVWRIAATSVPARLGKLLEATLAKRTRFNPVPRLATEAERLESAIAPERETVGVPVWIACQGLDDFSGLAAALAGWGHSPIWLRPGLRHSLNNPGFIVFDFLRGDAADWRSLEQLLNERAAAPVIVTMGFPRFVDRLRAEQLSRSTSAPVSVLAKPFRLEELRFAVEVAVGGRRPGEVSERGVAKSA